MGGVDKGLQRWRGLTLCQHVLARLAAQTLPPRQIAISANRHQAEYESLGFEVFADRRGGFAGPLAGIEAAWSALATQRLLFVACDMPLLPLNLAENLLRQDQMQRDQPPSSARYAITADGPQPVCCLLDRTTAPLISAQLDTGQHRLLTALAVCQARAVLFGDATAFTNFNSLAELHNDSM